MATPIGNLQDITLRALKVLAEADFVAAEDTRVAGILLNHHGISTRMISVHEHNEKQAAERVLERLGEGKSVALITDSGTPALSDPGAILVDKARAAGFRVTPVPGPNAAVAAVSVSGLRQPEFLFLGFLPSKPSARRKAIAELRATTYPMVIYEAPHRVVECVEDLAAGLGPARSVVFCRELTKHFEEIHACPLADAAAWLRADSNRQRGEFVLVVGPAVASIPDAGAELERVLAALLAQLPLAQAVKLACAITGEKRNRVYAHALQLAGGQKDS